MSTATYHGKPVEFLGIHVRDTGNQYKDCKLGPARRFPGYGDIRLADGTVKAIRLDCIGAAR